MTWFRHDILARNDIRVVALRNRHGPSGYGVYFMLLEMLAESPDHMLLIDYDALAYDLRCSQELIREVVTSGLFRTTADGTRFYSERMLQYMRRKETTSQRRSEAGKQGGRPRKQMTIIDTPTPPPRPEAEVDYFPELRNPNSQMAQNLCLRYNLSFQTLQRKVQDFLLNMRCRTNLPRNRNDAYNYLNNWLLRQQNGNNRQSHYALKQQALKDFVDDIH